jgi:hypothetical protein
MDALILNQVVSNQIHNWHIVSEIARMPLNVEIRMVFLKDELRQNQKENIKDFLEVDPWGIQIKNPRTGNSFILTSGGFVLKCDKSDDLQSARQVTLGGRANHAAWKIGMALNAVSKSFKPNGTDSVVNGRGNLALINIYQLLFFYNAQIGPPRFIPVVGLGPEHIELHPELFNFFEGRSLVREMGYQIHLFEGGTSSWAVLLDKGPEQVYLAALFAFPHRYSEELNN